MHSKHHLNLTAFAEPLSPEARYWVGFLLADGCISDNRICLGLKFEDAEHVKKFARFVGILEESVVEFSYPCHFGQSHGVRLRFNSKETVKQLSLYGIVPRKTKIATVPPTLLNDPDFWRGLVDGDGSVGKNKGYNYIILYGTFAVVSEFQNLCEAFTGHRPSIKPQNSIFRAGISCSKATKLLKWLYYPGAVALERKANAWQN